MRRRGRGAAQLCAAVLALAALAAGGAPADELKPFEASYAWIWGKFTVAVTTLKLEKTGDTWTYTSRSEPRGIGRMYPQRPRTVSVLEVTAAGVRPLSYQADDGTSSGKRSIDVRYDWDKHRITGVYEGTAVDLPLTPDVQDDSSLQVAIMVDLLHGHVPDHFLNLEKNSVREYRYQRVGDETINTALGTESTVIYSSQKAYSPRVNRYWCAPDHGYIPLRVQQKKGDDVEWTMQIESLKRD
jgi:Protein of unknown function (DUF3108)